MSGKALEEFWNGTGRVLEGSGMGIGRVRERSRKGLERIVLGRVQFLRILAGFWRGP